MTLQQAPLTESAGIEISGMNCASCVAHVEKAARAVPGVTESLVNLARGQATVRFDPRQTDPTKIADAIGRSGYPAKPEQEGNSSADAEEKRLQRQTHEASAWYRRAVVGIVLWLPVELAHWVMQVISPHAHMPMAAQSTWMGWLALGSSTVAIVYVGSRFYASALSALRHGTSNMDTLISLGASVAYGYSLTRFVGGMIGLWQPPDTHDLFFMEASGLLALISLGHWLEARARQSAGSAIRQLLELSPAVALRLTETPAQPDAHSRLGIANFVGSAPRTVISGAGESVRGADPTSIARGHSTHHPVQLSIRRTGSGPTSPSGAVGSASADASSQASVPQNAPATHDSSLNNPPLPPIRLAGSLASRIQGGESRKVPSTQNGSQASRLNGVISEPSRELRDAQETGFPTFAEVPVSELSVGDRVLVRPGDRIPIDGIVLEGRSSVDESMISGESVPVSRKPGDPVIGGTFNQDGRLIFRVTRTGNQTALAQIVGLVESAQSKKPPVQRLADQISAVFVPSVLAVALVTGIGWYAWGHMHGWPAGQTWSQVARTVCSVLIIACPCALGLAVPAAVMVGTGRGARRGILIRDIDALQNAEKIDTVVLDKTGTLTQGKPVVSDVAALDGMTADDVLRLAASAEQFSAHPLAKAIAAAARERHLTLADVEGFTTEAGMGIVAKVDQRELLIGSPAMLAAHGMADPTSGSLSPVSRGEGWDESEVATRISSADPSPYPSPLSTGERGPDVQIPTPPLGSLVFIAEKRGDMIHLLGKITLTDQLKPDSAAAISRLHAMGMHTIMLTGDNRATAESIARQVNVQDVRAEVKPADKAAVIVELQKSATAGGARRYVAMVGDGINDAPALAAAELGIAIGGGSDIAKEAGGIVLVSGSLIGVAVAIQLSRATMRKIRQNLFLAFVYNVIAIPLAAFGLLNPLIAAAAMALSDVTVIGNALLLRREKID